MKLIKHFLIIIFFQATILNAQSSTWLEYKTKAENGDANAQATYAAMYINGTEITDIDTPLAVYWWKKSAEQGLLESQFNLAYSYLKGVGIPKDLKKAFYWFKKSAEQNDANAQFLIGRMYLDGHGTLTDPNQAFIWFSKSAEQDYADAQYHIGMMYYSGQGTFVDKKLAKFWIKKAYDNGSNEAEEFWNKKQLWIY